MFRLTGRYRVQKAEVQSITVEHDEKVISPHAFQYKVPAGCLCVVSIFLNYSTINEAGWKLLKDKNFSPATICGALVSPGSYKKGDNHRWTKMDKVKF
ncbi:MAG: hypothetical protein ABWY16_03960 [Pedobacter sp.]